MGIQNSQFIPREQSDEIALMTELVLNNDFPNLFPETLKIKKVSSDQATKDSKIED